MLREIGYYSRMAVGIAKYAHAPLVKDADALLRGQLENRETVFLDTVRRAIFANPANPYHQMFRLAGCSFEDLAESVERDGLEAALAAVQRQGVYLTHDEFKGKTPIVRSGRHIPSHARSFQNPLVSGFFETSSSGSRSRGTRTRQSTQCRVHWEAYRALIDREFRLSGRCYIILNPILPSGMGLTRCLQAWRLGRPVSRWFTFGGTLGDSGHYRLATNAMVLLAKLLGVRMPFPTRLPQNDFSPVAEWIAHRREQGISCLLNSNVSPAVRVVAAVRERGLDLRGTLFHVGGEALTDAKRAVIEDAGCEVFCSYFATEVGFVGVSCREMKRGNCVHHFRDATAVIGRRRRAPLSDMEVDSLLFTSLLAVAPHVLINVEMDDSGVIEPARCDCTFTRFGFTGQIRDIWSYGKLTGQGITLVGSDIVRILEEFLPARFGGAPGDYQLVEQEGAAQTEILLRVSPRVGAPSTEEIKDCFLEKVRAFYGGSLTRRDWRHTGAVRVILAEPLAGTTGKVLPLHLLGSGSGGANAA